MQYERIWKVFWAWAGRVPLRLKILGIVGANILIMGFAMTLLFRSGLSHWHFNLFSEQFIRDALDVGTRGMFFLTIITALIGLLIAWILTWVLTRPILDITHVAEEVGKGNFSLSAPVWATDEIGGCDFS